MGNLINDLSKNENEKSNIFQLLPLAAALDKYYNFQKFHSPLWSSQLENIDRNI